MIGRKIEREREIERERDMQRVGESLKRYYCLIHGLLLSLKEDSL